MNEFISYWIEISSPFGTSDVMRTWAYSSLDEATNMFEKCCDVFEALREDVLVSLKRYDSSTGNCLVFEKYRTI